VNHGFRILTRCRCIRGVDYWGLTSLAAAWLTQNRQATVQRLAQDKSGQQKLYKEFIDEAARLYGDALAHNEAAVSDLVRIQALVSRMRVLSSSEIVEKAEKVVRLVLDAYFAPKRPSPNCVTW
jgi:hypothetical protein